MSLVALSVLKRAVLTYADGNILSENQRKCQPKIQILTNDCNLSFLLAIHTRGIV